MTVTIETNEQYEAAALRLGELSRASVETLDDVEFEQLSMAMMGFEARRLSGVPELTLTVGAPDRSEA